MGQWDVWLVWSSRSKKKAPGCNQGLRQGFDALHQVSTGVLNDLWQHLWGLWLAWQQPAWQPVWQPVWWLAAWQQRVWQQEQIVWRRPFLPPWKMSG